MSLHKMMTPAYSKLLSKIEGRANLSLSKGGSDYVDFENDIYQLLCILLPHSVLQSVRLFSPSQSKQRAFGLEMDNLFHIKHGGFDYIVSVEAKNQPVTINGKRWLCKYTDAQRQTEKKPVNEQIDNHIKLLNEYLSPVADGVELKFMSILVSADKQTPRTKQHGHLNSPLTLCSALELYPVLNDYFNLDLEEDHPSPEYRRITQSRFLSLLRMGQALPELGHPELLNAIRYAERCRRDLDTQIFQDFVPSSQLWAINGSAGMGKSVLLAYTACVLTCKFKLKPQTEGSAEVILVPALDTLESMGFGVTNSMVNAIVEQGYTSARANFPEEDIQENEGAIDYDSGEIGITALSQKQLDSLKAWYQYFVEVFQSKDTQGKISFKRPYYFVSRHANDITRRNWSALLVDEAHDLTEKSGLVLAKEHQEKNFFLTVACDRHQKLQHVHENTRLIKNLDFTHKTKRLKQIYRNPAPIYIASLGLMFRWFSKDTDGPVVLPTVEELGREFGFQVKGTLNLGYNLSLKNDAHPANSWSHTVASFPDVQAGYQALVEAKIAREDVLWVRFSKEDKTFDYERLQNSFTYHNCRTREAVDISDKYIKGQDFQIVVIEGFPGFMDNWENEALMWQFRRELYLCASRATCFLYFVCSNIDNEEGLRIRSEIDQLVSVCSNPANPEGTGTKEWKFHIPKSEHRRKLNVFSDTSLEELADTSIEELDSPTPQTEQVAQQPAEKDPLPVEVTPLSEKDVIGSIDNNQADPEETTAESDNELQWNITLEEQPSVASFAVSMEVEEIEIIEILNHQYDLRAVSSTPIPMPLAKRIAAEKYDCYVTDNTPKVESDIETKKREALDLVSEQEISKPQLARSEKQKPKAVATPGTKSRPSQPPPSFTADKSNETIEFVAVVDHINLRQQFVSLKYPPDKFTSLSLGRWSEAINLNPGDCIRCTAKMYGSNGQLEINKYEKQHRQEIQGLFIRAAGNIEQARDKDFGFINTLHGSIYVPKRFASQYGNFDNIEGWAVRTPDKDKPSTGNHPGTKAWTYIAELNAYNFGQKPDSTEQTKSHQVISASSTQEQEKSGTEQSKVITIRPPIIVSELADAMNLKPYQLMSDLIKLEVFAAPNQALEPDVAGKLCQMHGHTFKLSNIKT